MSRSLARVVGTPSYGETQFPEVAWQALFVTTSVPSRLSTAACDDQPTANATDTLGGRPLSLVSHVPEMVSQVLNSDRA
jgi:hypothetical protein